MASKILEIKEFSEVIPIFDGKNENLTNFLHESEKLITLFHIETVSNTDKIYLMSKIKSKIQGEAAIYLSTQNITIWDELKNFLLAAYGDKRDDSTLVYQITHLKQFSETPLDFYKKIQQHLNLLTNYILIHKQNNLQLQNFAKEIALKSFLFGLKDEIGKMIRTKDPKTLEEALSLLNNTFAVENRNTNYISFTPRNSTPQHNQSFTPRNFTPQNFTPRNFTPQNNQNFTPRPNQNSSPRPFQHRNRTPPQQRNHLQNVINSTPTRRNNNFNVNETHQNFLEIEASSSNHPPDNQIFYPQITYPTDQPSNQQTIHVPDN